MAVEAKEATLSFAPGAPSVKIPPPGWNGCQRQNGFWTGRLVGASEHETHRKWNVVARRLRARLRRERARPEWASGIERVGMSEERFHSSKPEERRIRLCKSQSLGWGKNRVNVIQRVAAGGVGRALECRSRGEEGCRRSQRREAVAPWCSVRGMAVRRDPRSVTTRSVGQR